MNHPIGPLSHTPCRDRRPERPSPAARAWRFAIGLASLACLAILLMQATNVSPPLEHLGFPLP